jgi:hypothetical protein
MKSILVIAFFLFTINAFSQTKNTYKNPAYFLDSIQVNGLGTFDNSKIEDIKVLAGDSAFPNGRIYMTSKKSSNFNFLSAQDILTAYKIPAGTTTIFMLDNEIIKDISNFRIDSSYILNVEVTKASEIEYLPNSISSLEILKVFTASKENNDKLKIVRIHRKDRLLVIDKRK